MLNESSYGNFDNSLSDVTIDIDVDSLMEICNSWNNSLSQIDIDSINVKQIFSPLNSCNIAVSYVQSLETSLNDLSSFTSSISKDIANAASEQLLIDNYGMSDDYIPKNRESNEVNDTNDMLDNSFTDASFDTSIRDSASTSINNSSQEIEVNTEFINKINSLSANSYNNIMALLSLGVTSNNSLTSFLTDVNYADSLKKKFLKSNDIPNDMKNLILEMDSKVLQKSLYSLVTDFNILDELSRNIIYTYTENFANSKNTTISEILNDRSSLAKVLTEFGNYSKVFVTLLNDNDFNRKVFSIYDGSYESNLIKDEVLFVRDVIETIAQSKNISPELLMSKNNGSDLKRSFEDLAKSFNYINNLGYTDLNTSTSILKNILV